MRRALLGLVVGVVVLAVTLVAIAGTSSPPTRRPAGTRTGGPQRVAVAWESIELSGDRRTITVSASFPLEGLCVKEPDGVDVKVDGDIAYVNAWMRGPRLPLDEGTACTSECGLVPQSVTLPDPLPIGVTLEPARGAAAGCW